MSPIGNETSWPRKDNMFKHKESLSYNDAISKVWLERPVGQYEEAIEICLLVLCGLLIALSALIMDIIEESLIHFKDHWAQTQIENNNNTLGWLVYASFSALLGVLSCVMTTYWGPGAAGSGVAEVIGYLNGINYP